ncbi:MAG TPA: lysophospholipid acyltransferase family protein [Opitutaceae bacterium]|jgi:1-acyl-sn-glycerol-3-phosphate acyltransferase
MIVRAWYFLAYACSWLLFAAGAVALTLVCIPWSLFPASHRRARHVRAVIRGLFRIWVAWLEGTGLVRINWDNFAGDALPRPAVYVANHPGLLDATFLLARLPDAVCLVKPAVLRNPLLGLSARMAGYASTEGGVDSIREMAQRLNQGCAVLIFPEGTRTRSGRTLNALKPGFSLVARRGRCHVEIVTLRGEHDLLAHGQGVWPLPHFPNRWRIKRAGQVGTDELDAGMDVRQRLEEVWAQDLSPSVCA